jgi:hypothetical protein
MTWRPPGSGLQVFRRKRDSSAGPYLPIVPSRSRILADNVHDIRGPIPAGEGKAVATRRSLAHVVLIENPVDQIQAEFHVEIRAIIVPRETGAELTGNGGTGR